jgi:polyhydroxyalkanoate synthesis repressor PhaR
MAVLIKRYANRKLYNTAASRYVTLRGIAELLEAGEEVRVVDNETGEDITAVTLSQILVDTERGGRSAPGNLISELFTKGSSALADRLRDAREDLEELRGNLRGFVGHANGSRESGAGAQAEFERLFQRGFERMAEALDIPRRSELREISERLDRLTRLIEEREARVARAAEQADPPRRRAGER